MTYLLFTYILSCFSASVPLNSHVTIFRGRVSIFFQIDPHSVTSCTSGNSGCTFCTHQCCGSTGKTPILLVVSRKLLEMTFFSCFFFSEHISYLPVVLWTIALWSSNLGCVFSTCLSCSDRRLCTIGLFCLG